MMKRKQIENWILMGSYYLEYNFIFGLLNFDLLNLFSLRGYSVVC